MQDEPPSEAHLHGQTGERGREEKYKEEEKAKAETKRKVKEENSKVATPLYVPPLMYKARHKGSKEEKMQGP